MMAEQEVELVCEYKLDAECRARGGNRQSVSKGYKGRMDGWPIFVCSACRDLHRARMKPK